MKHLCTLLAASIPLFGQAQSELHIAFSDPDPNKMLNWQAGALYADGDIAVVLQELNSNGSGDPRIVVARLAPDGIVRWAENLADENPVIKLRGPYRVTALPDGELMVYGDWFEPLNQYNSRFATRFDASGQQLWARIYAPYGVMHEWFAPPTVTPVTNNELMFSIPFFQRNVTFNTGADGGLLQARTIAPDSVKGPGARAVLEADGSILVTTEKDHEISVCQVDATNHVLWSSLYASDSFVDRPIDAITTANGDHVIVGSRELAYPLAMRISPTGALIWYKSFPGLISSSFDRVRELDNGDLLFSIETGPSAMLHATSNGDVLGIWKLDPQGTLNKFEMQSSMGNMVLIGGDQDDPPQPVLHILNATGTAVCGLQAVTPTTPDSAVPTIHSETVSPSPVTMHSWTMALYPTSITLITTQECSALQSIAPHTTANTFDVYPSVFTSGEELNLRFSEQTGPVTMDAVDALGHKVTTTALREGTNSVISTEGWASGVYVVRAFAKSGLCLGERRVVAQ